VILSRVYRDTRSASARFPDAAESCHLPSSFRPHPPNVQRYQDLRGTSLGRAIAKIVPKPGHGVGHCGRPKRRGLWGERPLPRLTLPAGRPKSSSGSPHQSSGVVNPTARGRSAGVYPERAMRAYAPSTGESKRRCSDPASIVPALRSRSHDTRRSVSSRFVLQSGCPDLNRGPLVPQASQGLGRPVAGCGRKGTNCLQIARTYVRISAFLHAPVLRISSRFGHGAGTVVGRPGN
jgi:hypothetical protein